LALLLPLWAMPALPQHQHQLLLLHPSPSLRQLPLHQLQSLPLHQHLRRRLL
jgi:hypothetical protein